MLLDDDSLEGFESSLDPVLRDPESSEDVREVARALNQVLEDVADRRLDRTEALRRMTEETHLAQDFLIPVSKLGEMLELCHTTFDRVYPVWLCPPAPEPLLVRRLGRRHGHGREHGKGGGG